MRKRKSYISTFPRTISLSLITVTTEAEDLSFVKSHVSLIMWSHDTTLQNKNISPLAEDLQAPNLTSDDLKYEASTHFVFCHFNHVITLCNATKQNGSSNSTRTINIKFGNVVT